MEILSCSWVPCCRFDDFVQISVGKNLSSRQRKVLAFQGSRVLSTGIYSGSRSLGLSKVSNYRVRNIRRQKGGDFKVLLSGSDGHVIDGEEDATKTYEVGEESASKVRIPGLPDESKGEHGAPITSCFWEWKTKLTVHYEKAGCENVDSPPVLFLPGFGAGSFHYEKQLKDLGREYRVFALDFLGQGRSLPVEDPTSTSMGETKPDKENHMWGFGENSEPWASELVYSMDLWQDQVRSFIEEVISEPVYVVGNSLGGYVAVYMAACNPQLVKGITLLNATPFWGLLPNPESSPRLSKMFPWTGTFPLPPRVRKLAELVWQKMSDPETIAQLLRQVYADHTTNVDKVFSRIVETTQHPAAAAAFASIMFAPQGQLSFTDALSGCQENDIQICLLYGKEDPWVGPFWGLQVKRQVPAAVYYEISPAGHCPHDEVPEVINFLLRGWIKNLQSQGSVTLPLLNNAENLRQTIAREVEFARGAAKKSVKVKFVGSRLLFLNWITSLLRSPFGRSQLKPSKLA